MMDQEVMQPYDIDLEDGEVSDSSEVENDDVDVYTPLQRPSTLTSAIVTAPSKTVTLTKTPSNSIEPLSNCKQMEQALEEDINNDDSNNELSSISSSGESTDSCMKKLSADGSYSKGQRKKKRIRRTVMVRVQPTDELQEKQRARFKKYDIWTAGLQEDALTENMRGIEVARSGRNDRNVENYDYSLRYRLNGENCLKRRLSNSTDDISDNEYHQMVKRGRSGDCNDIIENLPRRSAKSRLGNRRDRTSRGRRGSSPTSGSDTNSYEPRYILDLDDPHNRDHLDVGREIANKLYEEHDELIIRIVEVLGTELPIEIYKETQRIEADGGMMIKNGLRRRTPGGIFLFLLKEDERLTNEERKLIFATEQKNANKWRKEMKALSRERKVEELKKRLNKQKELPALSTRKEHFLLGSELSLESQTANLSNPPPSPVGQEHSPEYKAHAINHVQPEPPSPEKPSTSASALAALTSPSKCMINYDDDFLDINCGDMDFF